MDQPDPTPPDEEVLSAQIVERLLHYDELDEKEFALLEKDPSSRKELHRLQLAEAWLSEPFSSDATETTPESPCPSAEDLFDYGQKIEPTGLSIARQVELAEHLALDEPELANPQTECISEYEPDRNTFGQPEHQP